MPQELRSLERPLFKPGLCRLGSSLAFLPAPRGGPDFARCWLRGLGCFQYPASGAPCVDTVHDETSDNDGQNAGCHGKQLHNGIRNNNRFHCLPLIGCDANSYFRTRISTAISVASVSTYRRRGSCKCSLQRTEKRPSVQPCGPTPMSRKCKRSPNSTLTSSGTSCPRNRRNLACSARSYIKRCRKGCCTPARISMYLSFIARSAGDAVGYASDAAFPRRG